MATPAHKTVNHSVEFVNSEGYDTNKIEGQWRQMKVSLPTHGRKKEHYSPYLAEFIWRYVNRDKDLFRVFTNCKTKKLKNNHDKLYVV